MTATLLLDVGAGLNLLASQRAATIAAQVRVRFALELSCVADCDLVHDEDGVIVSAGLQTQVDEGVIELVGLNPEELGLYIRLAGEIGDQEAATLTAAASRRRGVLSDDPVLTRAASALSPPVPIRTTAALLHAWARTAEAQDVASALRRVEQRAAFTPSTTDPWVEWWHEQLAPSLHT